MTEPYDHDYWTEVSRRAVELASVLGWNAHEHATQCAAAALAEGKIEEYEFWKSVEAALTPRVGDTPERS